MYIRLLEVFCKKEDSLVRQNQTEIMAKLTMDTARNNVLFLF